jgi:hypothetical protein
VVTPRGSQHRYGGPPGRPLQAGRCWVWTQPRVGKLGVCQDSHRFRATNRPLQRRGTITCRRPAGGQYSSLTWWRSHSSAGREDILVRVLDPASHRDAAETALWMEAAARYGRRQVPGMAISSNNKRRQQQQRRHRMRGFRSCFQRQQQRRSGQQQ